MGDENEELKNWDPMGAHARSEESANYQRGPGRNLPLQKHQGKEGRGFDVFVRDIPKEFDQETVRSHFSSAGTVTKVNILAAKQGFVKLAGFVSFNTLREANRAIELLHNTPPVFYSVAFALSKEERERRKIEPLQDEARVDQYNASEANRIEGSRRRYESPASTNSFRSPQQGIRGGCNGNLSRSPMTNQERTRPVIKGDPPCTYKPCPNDAIYNCSRCVAPYCGSECRDLDWQRHKVEDCEITPPLVPTATRGRGGRGGYSPRTYASANGSVAEHGTTEEIPARRSFAEYSRGRGRGGLAGDVSLTNGHSSAAENVDSSFSERGRGRGGQFRTVNGAPRGRGGFSAQTGPHERDRYESEIVSRLSSVSISSERSKAELSGRGRDEEGQAQRSFSPRITKSEIGSRPDLSTVGVSSESCKQEPSGQANVNGVGSTEDTRAFDKPKFAQARGGGRGRGGFDNDHRGSRGGLAGESFSKGTDESRPSDRFEKPGTVIVDSTEGRGGFSGPMSRGRGSPGGQRGRGFEPNRNLPLENGSTVQVESTEGKKVPAEPLKIKAANFQFAPNTEIEVLFIRNPHQVFVRPVANNRDYSVLMDKLQNLTRSPLKQFEAGGACTVFKDGKWHRCEVVRLLVDDPSAVPVRLVDTGSVLKVEKKDVYTLDDDLVSTPSLSFMVKLGEIPAPQDGKWDKALIDSLKELVTPSPEYKILMTVNKMDESGTSVTMKDDQNNDIVQLLAVVAQPSPQMGRQADVEVPEKQAIAAAPSAAVPSAVTPSAATPSAVAPPPTPKSQPQVAVTVAPSRTASPAVETPAPRANFPRITNLPETFVPETTDVCILSATNANSIVVQCLTAENTATIDNMMAEAKENGESGELVRPAVGQLIVCQFTDGLWYRAEVVNVMDDNCDVRLVDFGDLYTVSFDRVKKFVKSLAKYPPFSVTVRLSSVPESAAGMDRVTEFLKGFVEKPGHIKVVDASSKPRGVILTVGDINVNSAVSEMVSTKRPETPPLPQEPPALVARPAAVAKTYRLPEPHSFESGKFKFGEKTTDVSFAIGQAVEVLVVHIEAPTEFYVIKSDSTLIEEYGQLEVEMSSYCEQMIRTAYNPDPNEIVMASHEGAWYRAVALEANGDFQWKIMFLDYGNIEDNVKTEQLRRMIPRFMHIPFVASGCFLSGYLDRPEEVITRLTPLLKEQLTGKPVTMNVLRKDPGCYYEVSIGCLKLE